MATFCDIAHETCYAQYNSLLSHQFFAEIIDGTLSEDIFTHNIEQDSYFLKYFAKTIPIVTSLLHNMEYIKALAAFSLGAINAEQNDIHDYFRKKLNKFPSGVVTNATFLYTNHLMALCFDRPAELAVTALAASYSIYAKLGAYIYKNALPNNKYQTWIDVYASDEYADLVDKITFVANGMYEDSSSYIKSEMMEEYRIISTIEWHFCNDIYNLQEFFKLPQSETGMKNTFSRTSKSNTSKTISL